VGGWVGRLIHSLYGLTREADILHIHSYRFWDPGKNPKFNIPPPGEGGWSPKRFFTTGLYGPKLRCLIHSLYGFIWEAESSHIDTHRLWDPGKNANFQVPPPGERGGPRNIHMLILWGKTSAVARELKFWSWIAFGPRLQISNALEILTRHLQAVSTSTPHILWPRDLLFNILETKTKI